MFKAAYRREVILLKKAVCKLFATLTAVAMVLALAPLPAMAATAPSIFR